MVDDIAITAGTGTTIAADNISSVYYQRVKTTWGPDGTANDADVATGKPLPIQVRSATGLIPFGEPTDAKSTATDTTSVTAISVWKQISASVQSLVTGTVLAAGSAIVGLFKISDGTNTATVKAASTAPGATDTALVVSISPNSVNANGRATAANSAPVTLPSDAAAGVSVTFTPAASSHTAGDCVGAAGSFAALGASASSIMITSATLYIDNTAALATAWRLHLYNVTPTSAIADDAAWDFADADVTQYLGYIDLPTTATDIGTNQWTQADGINKQVKMAGTGLFGYLQCLSTVTTTATAHIVTLNTVQL